MILGTAVQARTLEGISNTVFVRHKAARVEDTLKENSEKWVNK